LNIEKFIFVSGFKWSGSGALYELINENFDVNEIIWGDEFLPVSFGLLPVHYPRNTSFLRRFISLYFIDPKFHFVSINPIKKFIIKIFIYFLSIKSHWLKSYKLNIDKYFQNGLYNNTSLINLINDCLTSKESIIFCEKLLLIFKYCNLKNINSKTIILNNTIPGRYSSCLNMLDTFDNVRIFKVTRCIHDQVFDIKNQSLFGKYLPYTLIYKKIFSLYRLNKIHSNENNYSFEKIVFESAYRNEILSNVSFFISHKKPLLQFSSNCLLNSHKNISDHCLPLQ
jgi:hypothetical protein